MKTVTFTIAPLREGPMSDTHTDLDAPPSASGLQALRTSRPQDLNTSAEGWSEGWSDTRNEGPRVRPRAPADVAPGPSTHDGHVAASRREPVITPSTPAAATDAHWHRADGVRPGRRLDRRGTCPIRSSPVGWVSNVSPLPLASYFAQYASTCSMTIILSSV